MVLIIESECVTARYEMGL